MANEISTAKAGAVAPSSAPSTKLALAAGKIADIYLTDIANLNAAVGVPLTDESKRCGANVILSLCGELGVAEVQKLPKEQLVQVLQFVTMNGLDVNAGQVFLDKRWNKRDGRYDIKATPMGNAYEIMTKRFGVNVKEVHSARIVHEGDEFEMPQFDGLNMTNVKFKPTLKGLDGKAIAVYYIIEKNDGKCDFAIATREGVARNLMAQILNATLREEGVNRGELMKKLDGKTLDELLSDPELAGYISPAYRSPASRETMIVTKMKKNALLHYTRDLGSAAYSKIASVVENDSATDMVAGNNVVDVQDPDTKAEKPSKLADFEVNDEGEVEETKKPAENPAKPEPIPEVAEAKVEPKTAEEEPKEPKVETLSAFDVDDL